MEAVKVGIPLVMVPFFADQHSNAMRAARFGLGKVVHKLDLAKTHKLFEAVTEVIRNHRYCLYRIRCLSSLVNVN